MQRPSRVTLIPPLGLPAFSSLTHAVDMSRGDNYISMQLWKEHLPRTQFLRLPEITGFSQAPGWEGTPFWAVAAGAFDHTLREPKQEAPGLSPPVSCR